jgi:hypothetical protein
MAHSDSPESPGGADVVSDWERQSRLASAHAYGERSAEQRHSVAVLPHLNDQLRTVRQESRLNSCVIQFSIVLMLLVCSAASLFAVGFAIAADSSGTVQTHPVLPSVLARVPICAFLLGIVFRWVRTRETDLRQNEGRYLELAVAVELNRLDFLGRITATHLGEGRRKDDNRG